MNRSMRYVRRIAYALVMAATVVVMNPGSVHADDSDYPGSPRSLTLWDDTFYRERESTFESALSTYNDLLSFDDKASSVVNKTDYYWLLYDDTDHRERAMCIAPHSHYPSLADAGFNDQTSSLIRQEVSENPCGHWPIIGIANGIPHSIFSICQDGFCQGAECINCGGPCGCPPGPLAPPTVVQCLESASPSGKLTLWENTSCGGDPLVVQSSIIDDLDGEDFGDRASSLVNRTNDHWLLYDDTDHRDRAMCIAPNSVYPDLADAGFNDKTSSLIRKGTTEDTCEHWPIIGIANGIPNSFCGDGLCQGGETCSSCAADCGTCPPPPPPPPPPPDYSQCEPYRACQVFCLIGVSEPIGPDFCGCLCNGDSECPICLL